MHTSRIAFTDSTNLSRPAVIRARTRDSMMTFDQATVDSTGVYLVGQLERLDPKIHMPLVRFTWSRDVPVRSDVTFADDAASFIQGSFAAPGGVKPTGKNWISGNTNAIAGPSVDLARVVQPISPWGMELSWTVRELEKSQLLNQPIDQSKLNVMQTKWQMDLDEQSYVGDTDIPNCFGMFNLPNVPTLVAASTPWASASPAQQLADLNNLLTQTYMASGQTLPPTTVRMPALSFAKLAATQLPNTGESVISFLRRSSIATEMNGTPLDIQPVKWATGAGVGGTDRIVAYTKDEEHIRIPVVPLQRTPLEWRSLYQMTTYYGAIGQLEVPYPETFGYLDGV